MALRTCTRCGAEKPETSFYKKHAKSGKVYVRGCCGSCYRRGTQKSRNIKLKQYRAEGRMQAFWVKNNAKWSDKKKGRDNDLDLEFVKQVIAKPCAYCGRSTQHMTLDRIDNLIGHIRTNVVPACRRCNLVRNSMPYEPWLVVAEGMKKATELGLFGDWEGQTFRGSTNCQS